MSSSILAKEIITEFIKVVQAKGLIKDNQTEVFSKLFESGKIPSVEEVRQAIFEEESL